MSASPSTGQIRIRDLSPADRAAWERLWTDYLAFYETTRPAEVYDAHFARLTGPGAFRGMLAMLDGVPVGLSHHVLHPHGWQIEETCYLQDLYVDPGARGRGIGAALIEAVGGAARQAGARGLYWMTDRDNAGARALYDRVATLTPFIKYQRT